jgi:hypothetical protein
MAGPTPDQKILQQIMEDLIKKGYKVNPKQGEEGEAPPYAGRGLTYGNLAPVPKQTAAAPAQPAPTQAQPAPMQGPVNMNVIKFLNQYANMGAPQEYADQFAGGDLSKIQARTYRDEEGNPYNDYYIKGLLGG